MRPLDDAKREDGIEIVSGPSHSLPASRRRYSNGVDTDVEQPGPVQRAIGLVELVVPDDEPWSASVSEDSCVTTDQPAKNPGETGRLGLKPGVPGRFAGVSKLIRPTIRCL
jgi:hypothetical protein